MTNISQKNEQKWLYFDCSFIEARSQGPNDNMSSLVQVMTWHQTGDNSSTESMITQFIGTIHLYN